jgi:hypothetical protein
VSDPVIEVQPMTTPPRHRDLPTHYRRGLPLHAELYLIGHNDDTGEPETNETTLAIGLAGALLLELHLAHRVQLGPVYDRELDHHWLRDGQLHVVREDGQPRSHLPPTGSDLLDVALAAIDRTTRDVPRAEQLHTWLRDFAADDLYERTRHALATVGLLRKTERRRLFGTTTTYRAVDAKYPTIARTRAWEAVIYHQNRKLGRSALTYPDATAVGLSGLVAVVDLTPFLFRGERTRDLARWLQYAVDYHSSHHDPTHAAVVQAVTAVRGDDAVAAMA